MITIERASPTPSAVIDSVYASAPGDVERIAVSGECPKNRVKHQLPASMMNRMEMVRMQRLRGQCMIWLTKFFVSPLPSEQPIIANATVRKAGGIVPVTLKHDAKKAARDEPSRAPAGNPTHTASAAPAKPIAIVKSVFAAAAVFIVVTAALLKERT